MSQKRREQLFSRYATNLEILKHRGIVQIDPDVTDVFVCPLCFDIFTRQALADQYTLSLEHVPPKKVGGTDRNCTLTCKNCNNEAGKTLDSALKSKLAIDDFQARIAGAQLDVQYSPGEGLWLPATAFSNELGAVSLRNMLDSRRMSPADRKRALALLEAGVSDFKMMHRQPGGRRIRIALLRIAYLYAFRVLGYGLIFHPIFQRIQVQLSRPTEHILPGAWILDGSGFPAMRQGVNIILEPETLRSFVVFFALVTPKQQKKSYAVILPPPDEFGLNVYKEFELLVRNQEHVSFKLMQITEDPKYLTDPEQCYAA